MYVKTARGQTVYIDIINEVGSGAEGTVYKLSDSICAKILNTPDKAKEDKILQMLTYKGVDKVSAMPLEALYNDSGFVGYTMPFIQSDYYLLSLLRKNEREALFSNYSRRFALRLMYNLAVIIKVFHDRGIVVGDFNLMNWIIDTNDYQIKRLDCDSMQFGNYKCEVCCTELSGPEQKNPNIGFSKYSDSFSFAIILFQVLCDTHPFGIDTDENEDPFLNNILKGNCHYLNYNHWPVGIINIKEVYGDELFTLFKRCFEYNDANCFSKIKDRPNMEEWIQALKPFTEKTAFAEHCKICGEDYPNLHVRQCPYCKAQNAFSKAVPEPVKTTPSPEKETAHNNTVTQKMVVKSNTDSGGGWIFVIVLLLLGIAGWYCYTHGFDVDVCLELMINCIGGIIGIVILIGVIAFLWPIIKGLFYVLFIMFCLGLIPTAALLIIEVIKKLMG